MAKRIVLLSGSVAAGKTTLGESLVTRFGLSVLKTRQLILSLNPDVAPDRESFQRHGDMLDVETKGVWVRDALARLTSSKPDDSTFVVDSIRTLDQAKAIRKAYGERVFHIHLEAPEEVLSARYMARPGQGMKELASYSEVQKNATEKLVVQLNRAADVVIDTGRCTAGDVVVRAGSHLGLYGRGHLPLVDVLVGGGYGAEGKGHVASYLAREYDLLVRVGGPDVGHRVFELPRARTFRHLPSGTLSSEARLVIAAGAVVSVDGLLDEIAACGVDAGRLVIDPQALLVTDGDLRQETETDGTVSERGVAVARARRIFPGRSDPSTRLARDEPRLLPFVRDTCEVFEEAFYERRRILIEGTQGTGASLYHGTYPHVASRDSSVAGCLAEAGIAPGRVRRVVMVCRTYPIRPVNLSGSGSAPLTQPISWSDVADRSGHDVAALTRRERVPVTQQPTQPGEFDWCLLRRASSLNGPTDIALTFVDYLDARNRRARRFEQLKEGTLRFIQEVERVSAAPVSLISTRFRPHSIIDRRAW